MKANFKALLLIILTTVSIRAIANEVTIICKCHGFKTGELAIVMDKMYVPEINGDQFEVTMTIKESPQKMQLCALKKKKFVEFYAERGTINIETSSKSFLNKTHCSGSKSQDIANQIIEAERAADKQIMYDLLQRHINTLPGVDGLVRYRNYFTVDQVKILYNSINEPLLERARPVSAYLNTLGVEEMKKGNKAFDFSWNGNAGKEALSDSRGEYVLLNFTATGCKWCWKAYGGMNDLQEQYGYRLKVIAFHVDNTKDTWDKLAKRHGIELKFSSLWDVGKKEDVLAVYKIKILPTFILIDREGKIVDRWGGKFQPKRVIKGIK